ASGGSARDLRRQQAQGVPGVGKKADAVADRSGVPLLYAPCLSLPEPPPTRRENRNGFPGSQVFGTGTLPVGFQGRSALVAKGEIPVQEICTWREIQEIRVFLLDRTRIFGYIVSVIFKFIVIK
ncbi:hypothetical protein, partial [Victivallis vadensis]|uniref:hypothetical protein n=1 Tax=Victivallis vadensis TaxID=172901 RepID=UPI00307F7D0A